MSRGKQRWRDEAMGIIATYDVREKDAYEKSIVKVARRWRAMMTSRHLTQGLVDTLWEELNRPVPDDYGCGWEDLRDRFHVWAVEEEWLDP